MDIPAIITAGGVIVGGCWAVLEIHFRLRAKVEAMKDQNIKGELERLEKMITKLELRGEESNKNWSSQFDRLKDGLSEYRIALIGVAQEAQKTQVGISSSVEGFRSVVAQLVERSKVKDIGEGYVRVETKKEGS